MAEVYLARSFGVAGFEKHLVIKRIRPEFADNPRFVSMFINEAKIGVHLNHPNVVQVYELGRVEGSHYIAMEHLHGRDLTRLVKTLRAVGERLPLPIAVWVVAEVCRGLAYAHMRADSKGQLLGLVHRDVSPHNMLVTFAGEIKLVDFGIARLMHTAAGQSAAEGPARPGPGGGKYAYMSPEQAVGKEIDHRTDIFSAGIVLWELIVGHRLYQHPDPAEKLRRVQEAVIPHPSAEGVEIDDSLWEILTTALSADTQSRYSSAALFEEDLRAWLFDTRTRVDRADVAAVMNGAFPQEAGQVPDDLDLQRMVADVERLDPRDQTQTSLTPSHHTPSDTPLPGRLRPSVGERKQVSVLMVDVDGLTELSARVEPETLFKRHFQLLRWTRRLVDQFGGIIQRAIDDQILILFGVPRTQVDDLHRTLECALEIQRRAKELTRTLGTSVELAIGVHTGEVTVNMYRHRVRYDARGDTTRFARRLSATADHRQILTSERVLQIVGSAFRLHQGPLIPNRGGIEPSPSFLVEGRHSGVRLAGRGPWIRRGAELANLRNALVALASGKGASIALIGELGTGKSRLLREIREISLRRGIPFYGGRHTHYGQETLLASLRQILYEVLGGAETDDQVLTRTGRLAQLGLKHSEVEALAALLGARFSKPPTVSDSWHAFTELVNGLGREGPQIIAIEDIDHHREEELVSLAKLLRNMHGPVLFLLSQTSPPPAVIAKQCTSVTLGPFPPEAQRRLVAKLLDVAIVDDAICDLLERTCEGNPLYMQEMIKYLLQGQQIGIHDGRAELKATPDPTAMPHTLAGLISARIDALDPASKGLLQLAAIAGARFSTAVVAEAAGVDDPTPLVADLASNGLITPTRGRIGEWSFASDLVREAALRGTLGVQRRDYHRLIASALETIHKDNLVPWHQVLAKHCAEGGRLLDAARFAFAAGEALEQRQLLDRAKELYLRGLKWIALAPKTPDNWDARVQGEAMLNLRLGVVELLLGDITHGEHYLQIALDISSDVGLPWIEVRAHLELGRSYLNRSRYLLANAHIGQVRALLRIAGDSSLEIDALEAAAILAFEQGRHEEAQSLWEQALGLAQEDPSALARCNLGLANRYLRSGHHDKAEPLLEEALKATRQANNRILEGRVLNNIGLLHSWAGRYDEALEYYRMALEVRQGIGYTRGVAINYHNIGDVHFSRQDWARAYVAFDRSRELAAEMRWERGVLLNEVYLSYIDGVRGEGEVHRIQGATQKAQKLGDMEIATTGMWLSARLMIQHEEYGLAREELHRAIEHADSLQMHPMVEVLSEALESISKY
jgi:eukaryotic-like serine/threonine-protein kinase